MALIENSKIYSGKDLETVFFRPLVSGPTAEALGIRILYNMPQSSLIHLWTPSNSVLKPFEAGWQGTSAAIREQKRVNMTRVKAEASFDATDYYSTVFQHIVARADVNLQDLSGTELEEAETAIFKKSVAESLRVTMWIGSQGCSDNHDSFDGILMQLMQEYENSEKPYISAPSDGISSENITTYLDNVWAAASPELKSLKKEGELVYYVSSEVYSAFEDYVYNTSDNACIDNVNAHPTLSYRGIPLVDIGITNDMLGNNTYLTGNFCVLTDRRNLVLMLNTADFPEAEVRMWYNPDEMENRQRAVFLAAVAYIDFNLVVYGAN
ncbi:MAG: hypothetical protein IJW42_06785 [Alistipes sp.]|nr:hypothetical protein [Alistipes sp.]